MLLSVPQRAAQGFALAAIIPASALVSLTHYAAGRMDRVGLGQYVIAAAIGGALGASFAVQIAPAVLAVIFGCLLIVTGAVVFTRTTV
jgi:uncharacterized membrane protein YfcA